MNRRNRAARNAVFARKSWKSSIGHKGYGKRYVSKAARRGAKAALRNR